MDGTTGGASFTAEGLRRGVRGGLALVAGAIAYGLGFGVLADQAGLDLAEALLMSAVVNAGAAQFVALEVWRQPVPVAALCLAVLAMNARYLLLGAALHPWFRPLPRAASYGSLFVMGDGNWALAMREHAAGRRDAAYLLGSGLVMYAGWIAASGIGHGLGQALGEPRRLGLDFLLPAFFAALAVMMWRGRGGGLPLAVGAGVALLIERLVPGPWYVLAGGLAGAVAGGLGSSDER
ncbi:MAG: AzlC family ABC transporter permease [Alphaproteobacteria bacterium]